MMEKIQHGVVIRKPEERDSRDYVRGLSSGITPVVNDPNKNWSQYLPAFVEQKYTFDTNNCTGFSFVHTFEIQLNWLKATNKIAPEDLVWFQANGYIDQNGSFALSERFAGIIAGTTINGNSPWNLWKTASKQGILPRADLNYSFEQSQKFATQPEMCGDYYDKSVITPQMKQKALQALQRLVIQYEWLGTGEWNDTTPVSAIEGALTQAPVQIAVPVCLPGWNESEVLLCSAQEADHAVTLFAELSDDSWDIFDHYEPSTKDLSKGYFIPQAILGVVTPRPAEPVVSNPNTIPTPVELSAFQKILNWIQAKINSFRQPTSASAPPGMWEGIIESLETQSSMKQAIIYHAETFGLTFVSTFLLALISAASSMPIETVFSRAWLSVTAVAAVTTALTAAYNKTFYGTSTGVN